MDFLRILFTAVLPIIIIAFIIYRIDRFDKEPIKLLIKIMLLGAVATIPVIVIELLMSLMPIGGLVGLAYQAFIAVALTEELFKRLVVIIFAYRRPEFDEPLDGIVYCVFAALGFAAFENIMYVFSYQAVSPNIALYRGLLSVPAHTLFAVSMGYFLSLAKYSTDLAVSRRYYRKSLWVPVLLHGTYDFILFTGTPLMLMIFIPFFIYMWINGIKKLKQFAQLSKASNIAS